MKNTVYVISNISDEILSITLNRPEKHNCFGIPELNEMKSTLDANKSNKSVKAVVFSGAGERSFSTGADLKQFTQLDEQGTTHWIKKGHEVFNYIEHYPKPTVAVIQGYAMGGGLELALSCDLRIASENAVFGNPELSHGWLPGWGGIHRLKKIVGPSKTKEIIFLAQQIHAEEALRVGLIHQLCKTDQLDEKVNQLLVKLLKIEPDLFSMAKAAISGQGDADSTTSPDLWFDILGTHYAKNML